jgi:predicted dehydrogenase
MSLGRRARIGLVGAGWWATAVHLPALMANECAEVVGVCDLDAQRAHEVAGQYGLSVAVTSVEALLAAGLDGLVVATPHDAHYAPAAAAISAGVDVLVEKPMTTDPSQAWDLVLRAAAAGVALHVGHTYPYARNVQRLRQVIQAGDLGELNLITGLFSSSVHQLYAGNTEVIRRRWHSPYAARPSTYADPNRGGGHLFTQLAHAASVVLWATKRSARRVAALECRAGLAVDLADAITVIMDNGSVATLAGTGSVADNDYRVEEYRFFGSAGQALLDTAAGTLNISLAAGRVEEETLSAIELDVAWRPSAALVATALGRDEVVVPGQLGASVVDLLCAARESSRKLGASVAIGPHQPGHGEPI